MWRQTARVVALVRDRGSSGVTQSTQLREGRESDFRALRGMGDRALRGVCGAALLVAAALSVASWFLQATASSGGRLFMSNALPLAERKLWLGVQLGVGCAGVAACGVIALLRARAASGLARAARLASPLLLAWSFPALFTRTPWTKDELGYLVLLAVVLLCLEALLTSSLCELGPVGRWQAWLRRLPPRLLRIFGWFPAALVTFAVVYYAVRIGQLTVLNHERMATSTSDLGEFDNLFFNALHGHPFRSPAMTGALEDWTTLRVHAELVLYALLPFYALSPGPQALLFIQSSAIALSAVPVYLLASARIGRPAALVCALAVLLLPAVQRPNFT